MFILKPFQPYKMAMGKEYDAYVDNNNKIEISCQEKDGKTIVKTNVYKYLAENSCKLLKTDDIAMAFEPEEKYENPDGSPITFDTDIQGKTRSSKTIAGPFAQGLESFTWE